MKDYQDYKTLVASAEAHVSFLREVADVADAAKVDSQPMHLRLASAIRVGGKPFSQTSHLSALEAESDGWGLDEAEDALKLEMVALSRLIKQEDPGYDLAHFTHGFEYAVQEMKERGVLVGGDGELGAALHPKRKVTGTDYEPPSP